jgi:hypothetical protein
MYVLLVENYEWAIEEAYIVSMDSAGTVNLGVQLSIPIPWKPQLNIKKSSSHIQSIVAGLGRRIAAQS